MSSPLSQAARVVLAALTAVSFALAGVQISRPPMHSSSHGSALPTSVTGPGLFLTPVVPQNPLPVQPAPPIAPLPPPKILSPLEILQSTLLESLRAAGGRVHAEVRIDGLGRALSVEASRPYIPASTQKIYPVFAALSLLGPNNVFETKVLRYGPVRPDGILDGHLALMGGGDPSLTKADVEALARSVSSSGIRTVGGSLHGIEDRYDQARSGPGWKSDFVPHESGPLSALAIDRNSHRRDPDFVANPIPGNLELFRSTLAAAGVTVNGGNIAGVPSQPLAGEVVAAHRSAPLVELIKPTLQESDNFFAELLVKELGRTSGEATTAGGIQVIRRFAHSKGLPLGPSSDGSGLSSQSRQTADGQLEWLQAIERSELGDEFIEALPVSCRPPGTLKKRMCASAAAGRVLAKSGGLPQVATLTGYTTTASARRVRFSFAILGAQTGRHSRDSIDAALGHIAGFTG